MWANNETGVIHPMAELAELAAANDVLFHTDAVQAVGKIPISLSATAIHTLALSGHKIHGPKGIGALYVNKNTAFHPMLLGAGRKISAAQAQKTCQESWAWNGRQLGSEPWIGVAGRV